MSVAALVRTAVISMERTRTARPTLRLLILRERTYVVIRRVRLTRWPPNGWTLSPSCTTSEDAHPARLRGVNPSSS
jgi:hypothetical protein